MKKFLFLLGLLIISNVVYSQKGSKKFKDVFDLDAIKADQDYYSQAIIQFQILEKLIYKYGAIYHLYPKEDSKLVLQRVLEADPKKFDIEKGVPTMVLFPNINDGDSKENKINQELYKLGVGRCQYQIPLKLTDLDGGFQFNHYMFKSSNKAALDAFGIVKNSYESESLYIVIDYLQYRDYVCTGLPKIRYGVGIRSEIRINQWSDKLDVKESSLAGLAANAEINSLKVNITVKTIGITGLDSKLNIPNNTSFNVDTYADYQKIIDFIRNFDQKNKPAESGKTVAGDTLNKYKNITFKPQLIPVMDEYRTSITESFKPYYETLDALEKKLKKLYSQRNKYKKYEENEAGSPIDSSMVAIHREKIKSVFEELKAVKERKDQLSKANIYNSDITRYVALLSFLNGTSKDISSADTTFVSTVGDIKSRIDNIQKENNLDEALKYETKGFEYLFDKKIPEAITAFKNSEENYPQLHSTTEIIDYLNTIDPGEANWKTIYSTILKRYNWKLSDKIIARLKENSK